MFVYSAVHGWLTEVEKGNEVAAVFILSPGSKLVTVLYADDILYRSIVSENDYTLL